MQLRLQLSLLSDSSCEHGWWSEQHEEEWGKGMRGQQRQPLTHDGGKDARSSH
jgi:hypothetical protein